MDDKDIEKLKMIFMDKDKEETLKFLKDKIQSQILSREKVSETKVKVNGKQFIYETKLKWTGGRDGKSKK